MTNSYYRHMIIDEIIADHTERAAELSRERLLYLTNRSLEDRGLPHIKEGALDRDIRIFREEFGAPLENNRTRGYFYSDSEYRRFETVPDNTTLWAMTFTLGFLKNFESVPMIREAVGQFRQMLVRLRCLDAHQEVGVSDGFDIDFTFSVESGDALEKLFNACRRQSCVRVTCCNGARYDLSPLGFSFGPEGFVCRGYDALTEMEVEVPADCISDIRPANVNYVRQSLLYIPDVRRN